MSKIIIPIKICEQKITYMEFEKICVVYHLHSSNLFKVPKDNIIKTKFGTFKYDIDHAVPSGDMMICYFKTAETLEYERSLKLG